MPSIHLGVAIKGAANNVNYVSGNGNWRLNASALQNAQAGLDVCADVCHRSSNDYLTSSTSRGTNRNRYARLRDILVSDYAAVLGGYTVTNPASGASTVLVDSTAFNYGAVEPFVDAVLRASGNLSARSAIHRVKG